MSQDSESYITQLTLQYMVNKKQYGKYLEQKKSEETIITDREKYAERFLGFTEDMLDYNARAEDVPTHLKLAFENFLKTAIHHFKHLDEIAERKDRGDDDDNNSEQEKDDEREDEKDEEEEECECEIYDEEDGEGEEDDMYM
jgi:hypothetical protein